MEQVYLGESGLQISRVVMGCMSFGSKSWKPWINDDKQAFFDILNKAYEHGIRTFDTANVYSNGLNETWLGEWIKKYNINRNKIVILSKCFNPNSPELSTVGLESLLNPQSETSFHSNEYSLLKGLSRKNILQSVQASVERLGTYIDVLQIHRMDKQTPKKEIVKALNDVVDQGLARYIGASAMKAVEFAELQAIADKYNYHKFISMQSYYNLLYREDERELNYFCQNNSFGKVGLIPYSPLARGFVARPLDQSTERSSVDFINKLYGFDHLTDAEKAIIGRVEDVAKRLDLPMATVAIAWLWSKGACPIIGINKLSQIDDYLKAQEVKLSEEDIAYLEEPYVAKKSIM